MSFEIERSRERELGSSWVRDQELGSRESWVRDRDSRESWRREGLPLWELKAASASISLDIFGN